MAPKKAKKGKSKAASELEVVFDQLRFLTPENEETFETLIKRIGIFGEKGKSIYMNCILLFSTTRDVPYEDMHGDPTAAVAEDGDDEVDVNTIAATHTGPPAPYLRTMMETIMTTQVAHR
nr:hypothetical protein CFP56_51984 [Quercus suber]